MLPALADEAERNPVYDDAFGMVLRWPMRNAFPIPIPQTLATHAGLLKELVKKKTERRGPPGPAKRKRKTRRRSQ